MKILSRSLILCGGLGNVLLQIKFANFLEISLNTTVRLNCTFVSKGVVKEIEIFTTKLIGLSNREIILPNGNLSNDTIINYTTEGTRRVDLVFGIG